MTSSLSRGSSLNRAAAAAPEGDVALMFTDIEGSTKLWEALPDTFKSLLDLHSEVIREALR